MGGLASVARVARCLIGLVTIAGCGGKIVHLGDGRPDGGTCPHAQVAADRVLWIGDSWVLVTGSQHTHVRDLARAAGAIGPADDYVIGAVAASTMPAIAGQYDAREAGATKVKVLIEDGGTWETINAMTMNMTVAAAAASAATAFSQHLATVASDGTVDDVIYFLPPELSTIPGVAELRPLVQQVCTPQSTVRCHFLDLQPLFAAHPEYTVGFLPTDAGAVALGDAIWAVMQDSCIAQ